jgi:uncharacterized protein (DUF58 family)
MKPSLKTITLASVCSVTVALLAGCASAGGAPFLGNGSVTGMIYKNVKQPSQALNVAVDKDAQPVKVGKAKAISVLGLVGAGDASLQAAMRKAGITRVHHVDHRVMGVFGLYAEWEIMVYGE